jgi:hypothetical protein
MDRQTAHQYLCKPCSPIELKEAISRALFLRDLLANQHLQQFVSQLQSLPGVPCLYSELMIELQRSEPSLDEVTAMLSRDMGLSMRLACSWSTPRSSI